MKKGGHLSSDCQYRAKMEPGREDGEKIEINRIRALEDDSTTGRSFHLCKKCCGKNNGCKWIDSHRETSYARVRIFGHSERLSQKIILFSPRNAGGVN